MAVKTTPQGLAYKLDENDTIPAGGGLGEAFALRAEVSSAIVKAKQNVPPLWDVRDYVAVNPLFGLRDRPFVRAISEVRSLHGVELLPDKQFFRDKLESEQITEADLDFAIAMIAQDSAELYQNEGTSLKKSHLFDYLNSNQEERTSGTCHCITDLVARATGRNLTQSVTQEVSKWAAAYFDEGQATWAMPTKHKRFFSAWKDLVCYENGPLTSSHAFKSLISQLSDDPEEALFEMVKILNEGSDRRSVNLEAYFSRLLATVSGWASLIQKVEFEGAVTGDDSHLKKVGGLIDLLAVRMVYDLSNLESPAHLSDLANSVILVRGENDPLTLRYAWLVAYENATRRSLAQKIGSGPSQLSASERPLAQAAFCIDVRSEVLRRHLEKVSDRLQTIGFAGFFGLPVAVRKIGFVGSDLQCPVLIKPIASIEERSRSQEATIKQVRGQRASFYQGQKSLVASPHAGFAFAETAGFGFALKMLLVGLRKIKANIDVQNVGLSSKDREDTYMDDKSLDLSQRTLLAQGALTNMGLTKNFARYVFFFGHAGESSNNPYESALDCGACAGHSGHTNSKLLAQILNDHQVRAALAKKEIEIPEDTVFISGWHNTTRDLLFFDEPEGASIRDQGEYSQLIEMFQSALESCRRERAQLLPGAENLSGRELEKELFARARDWSEVRSEWALARNHSFVAATRSLTRAINLEGRSFLHDYDFSSDPNLSKLELIMTAPMVVANWINMQYYSSTIDPEKFGAGNKTINNVVGTIGCIQGNQSDLLGGLSEQSVRHHGRYFHEPIRLQVFIEAKPSAIDQVISKHKMVKELIENGWLYVTAIDPDTKAFSLRLKNSWMNLKEVQWN